ncbi:MAG: ABC transporter substrate-binding protein, partial [Prevotellaceae bacterium]|nr:ABC transporter substrate-binding protein [Prevotellaceae bacterium]
MKLKYSQLLTIVKHQGYDEVNVADPWNKGKILHKYILANTEVKTDDNATFVQIPLKRAVVFTSPHIGLISDLNAKESVAGVCDMQYIMAQWVKSLSDCGNAMNPNIEKIIKLTPDGIILSPFQNSGGYGKVEQLGVPLIEAADYMESSALGRAEWMIFYGMLFGKEQEARALFDSIEKKYNALASSCNEKSQHKASPKVMTDMKQSSSWYVPGGESTLGRMIADAGGDYAFKNDKRSGSIPCSIETMIELNHDADIWLIKYNSRHDLTLQQLKSDNDKYVKFKACKDGEVYGC